MPLVDFYNRLYNFKNITDFFCSRPTVTKKNIFTKNHIFYWQIFKVFFFLNRNQINDVCNDIRNLQGRTKNGGAPVKFSVGRHTILFCLSGQILTSSLQNWRHFTIVGPKLTKYGSKWDKFRYLGPHLSLGSR
jgi:hypothetical protein